MASAFDWLRGLLGRGDPEAEGLAAASTAAAPTVFNTLQSALTSHYDPNKSYRQNALDPAAIQQAMGVALGFGPGVIRPAVPRVPSDINPNSKIDLGTLYRGTGVRQAGNLNYSPGDIGSGVHVTPLEEIAATYGGGPSASVAKGTRVVNKYEAPSLYPEDVVYAFGASRYGDDIRLVSGNGIELWRGPYSIENVERALARYPGIKAVIGTPDSIGLNQVAIRDPSILRLLGSE